ncbi:MAG: alkaline phosphatase family protein [Terriglobia bacterium]
MPLPSELIKHLVVLMMENRSFDHMLGHMKSPGYPIEGLEGTETNRDSTGEPARVTNDARYSGDLTDDPSHDFEDVMEQMFGTQTPGAAQEPDMSGFVINYERFTHGNIAKAAGIMKCFDPARLPVLTTLAREYAVCDHWYSSVPGPTLPNRVFVHAGTSRGRLDLSPDFIAPFHTVYEVLWKNEVESALFYHDWSSALGFGFLLKHQTQFYATIDRFVELCNKDRLPSYSFIEPRYNPQQDGGAFLPANDQHPDHDVAAGEFLIKRVYEALRANDNVWQRSMLVIIYDEHGGLYDHVPPPRCVSPDGIVCSSPAFDFTRLGPRVPAVIISPYISPGTIVHDPFDHTSAIATAMKLFAPNAWPSDVMGKRAQNANTFEGVMDTTMSPRADTPNFTAPPVTAAPAAAPAPLSSLQRQALAHAAELESQLPHDKRTGIDPKSIQDEHQAGTYLREVSSKLTQKGGPSADD